MFEKKFISLDKLSIQIAIQNKKGASKNLLILHGWGGSIASWEKQLNYFKNDKLNIIIIDLPGFGKSDKPPKVWDLNNYTEFINNIIVKLDLNNFYLLGHSFGGQIATKYAHTYPNKLTGLFLVGAAAIRHPNTVSKKIMRTIAKAAKVFLKIPILKILLHPLRTFVYKAIGGSDYLKASSNNIMKETFQNVLSTDLRDILPKIHTKTTIVWGKGDSYTPLRDGKLIHSLIPHSSLHILEDAQHGVHLQTPQKLHDIVMENIN